MNYVNKHNVFGCKFIVCMLCDVTNITLAGPDVCPYAYII